jgi:hypothetical protein
MPRKLRSAALDTRTARLKLAQRRKPYWITIAPGISLGYRRNLGPGTWTVRSADGKGGSWIRAFAAADDHEDADGSRIMNFWQAADRAKALARGDNDADARRRPATVDDALRAYADDLRVRGAGAANASHPRGHLTAPLLSMPVSLLTVRELRHWRNNLTATMKPSSANRTCKNLKAALSLAAAHDDRIVNSRAWTIGLAAIPEDEDVESNLVLSDEQRRDLVAAAYAISP